MRSNRITSQSLLISLILHGIILIVLGAYIAYTQSPEIQEFLAGTFLKPQAEEKPSERPPELKVITIPTIPKEQPVIIEEIPILPRVTTATIVRAPTAATATTVLEFSNVPVQYNLQIDTAAPEVKVKSNIVTHVDIVPSTTPGAINLSPPSGSSAKPGVGRGIVGKQIRAATGRTLPNGLTMIKNISVADTGLTGVVEAVRMGNVYVPPLPRGEPGGHVVGDGKNIRGVFRLARIHHDLSDWWADQSSLVALTEWLNTETEIKTDMNIEGGALRLTDPKLSKAPLAFFTGHDPNHVRTNNLARGAPLKNRLSEQERNGLRKYLVEDGGFLYFDDCGVNYATEAFVRLVSAQLRYALPEHPIDRIPNNHEIYHNYYDMGGPPVGFDIFWWGTHPPKRNFLEGISVDGELRALICRRDYMCAMESVSLPTRAVHYSPGVYRFSTNVVIYALTHGGISDHAKYVPENTIADEVSISAPTLVPSLE